MRIGEIRGLTWDCIHIEEDLCAKDEAYLLVEKELRRCSKESLKLLKEQGRDDVFFTFPEMKLTGYTTSLVLKTPKTESSVRTIYLPARVTTELKKFVRIRGPYRKLLVRNIRISTLSLPMTTGGLWKRKSLRIN